jgi:hypothetical protein
MSQHCRRWKKTQPSIAGGRSRVEVYNAKQMDTLETFQYSPDLLSLLIDAVPKLCKSKDDLLLFFQGVRGSGSVLAPHKALLQTDREALKRTHVTREK